MKHEAFPPHDHAEGRFASSSGVLGVSRTLLANTADYVEYLGSQASEPQDVLVHDDAARDLLKHFYELASAQMSESVIDQRLFPSGEMTEPANVLRAMQEVLASWQRGSIVASQEEPLHEFALWLLDAQRAVVNGVEDDALQHRIARGIDMAEKRLLNN